MNSTRLLRLALAATGLAAAAALHAQTFTFDFDAVPSGTAVNSFAPSGVSFHQAYFAPSLDGFGDPILGSEHWQIDPLNDPLFPVLAENPADYTYGAAPSGTNALNALWQPVLIRFDQAYDLQAFATTLDNSTFGDLSPASIWFVTDTGTVGQLSYDQTSPGLLVSTSGTYAGITGIVLGSGAFYDNVSISLVAIPEPSTWALLLGGASLGAVFVRRWRTRR